MSLRYGEAFIFLVYVTVGFTALKFVTTPFVKYKPVRDTIQDDDDNNELRGLIGSSEVHQEQQSRQPSDDAERNVNGGVELAQRRALSQTQAL